MKIFNFVETNINSKIYFMKISIPFTLFFVVVTTIGCSTVQPNGIFKANTSVPVSEETEFRELMKKDAEDRKARAAEAVNQFLSDEPNDPKAAILFKNNSNCNIIVRISGKGKSYNLPVEKNNLNYIVLEKGSYQLKSNLCRAKYLTTKNLVESIEINLSEN